ncbi:hypothetical protein [uncultured Aquimarina sp.]|uniref:hypothetical protein n=1 Tax=uncultured Aquimarina sp. TaxID=575652 RepID=UPI002636DC5A|nr:hypothetical protein [uncultured Aquimarina sp.]
MSSGEIQFISRGFDKGNPYYQDVSGNLMKVQDSAILSWSKNANPYQNNKEKVNFCKITSIFIKWDINVLISFVLNEDK